MDDGTYFEVKVNDEESHVYNNIKYWMDEFIAAGGVHPNDVERFKEFFNPFILKTKIVDKWPRVFYRRLIDKFVWKLFLWITILQKIQLS